MGGRQGLYSAETGHRARQRAERKELVDAARVGPRLDKAGRQQRLDLGGKQQPFALRRALPGPVKRTDAEAVARQEQPLPPLVVERNGKLAAHAQKGVFLMIFPKMRDDFRIAVRGETVPAAFQVGALLDVIKQFAVVDDKDAAVLV